MLIGSMGCANHLHLLVLRDSAYSWSCFCIFLGIFMQGLERLPTIVCSCPCFLHIVHALKLSIYWMDNDSLFVRQENTTVISTRRCRISLLQYLLQALYHLVQTQQHFLVDVYAWRRNVRGQTVYGSMYLSFARRTSR